jgi:hypothetical protein
MGRRLFLFALAVGAAITVAGAAMAFASTDARAASNPNDVCCFRVTVDISGFGQTDITPSTGKDSSGTPYDPYSGSYVAFWDGTFYQIFRLHYGELRSVGQGVGLASLDDEDGAKAPDGRYHDRCDGPDNYHPMFAHYASAYGGNRLSWLQGDGLDVIPQDHHLSAPGRFWNWRVSCVADFPDNAQTAAYGRKSCSFFFCDRIAGLSLARLRRHRATSALCKFRAEVNFPPTFNGGGRGEAYSSAYYVNIVPFPESQLKAQRERLRSRHGKEVPNQNPAARASRDPNAPNGCS